MTAEQDTEIIARKEYILEFLRNEGYCPTVNVEDGDIEFKKEGAWYYLTLYNDDAEYYRIHRDYFWGIEDETEKKQAYLAVNNVNRGIKVAKVYVVGEGENISAVVDSFYHDATSFTLNFDRSMRALLSVLNDFRAEMQRLKKQQQIRCPLCGWQPDGKPHWTCEDCSTHFDTFKTHAHCPNSSCGKSWSDTQCISCHKMSPHGDWYGNAE